MAEKASSLRFDGSTWCNLDIALRNLDQIFRHAVRPLGITVIEWYILRALYTEDGQHASELARAVGRAATSFTPNLDKLEQKGYIERRPDAGDRRAIHIYLTEKGEKQREKVVAVAESVDRKIAAQFSASSYRNFLEVVAQLQVIMPDA